jgi:hypothetical protein
MFAIRARDAGVHMNIVNHGSLKRKTDFSNGLLEAADQVEEQLAARLGEWQLAAFIEDDEIDAREPIGDTTLAAKLGLGLKLVDQVEGMKKRAFRPALIMRRAMPMAM